jgi:CelD/BcsL family acetyltransferase involved in cellulose biosynthesis
LVLGDQPSAFALCEGSGNLLLYKLVGHAPEHSDLSPGTVLLWHILAHFFRTGEFEYLDFGEGEGFYKHFFSNLTLPCARVYYFKYTPVLLAVVLMHRCWNLAIDSVVRVPGIPAIVKKARHLLRSRAASRDSHSRDTSDSGPTNSPGKTMRQSRLIGGKNIADRQLE